MSTDEPSITVDIRDWVERASADPQRYLERQATEVLLAAVGQSPLYGERLYLKGGVLMGVVYQSPRQTADLDFTAEFAPMDNIEDELRAALDPELQRAAARLGYPGLVCCVQRIARQPRRDHFVEASFPALDITIAYANRDSPAYARLREGQCSTVLNMEISFHEPVHAVELVRLSPDTAASVHAYSLIDVIAEKLRALLQQEVRDRNRRQDIYDIDFLVRTMPPDPDEKQAILEALLTKARARNIEPSPDSLGNPEVKRRAEAEWGTLELEVGELPTFDDTFATVEDFYRALPW